MAEELARADELRRKEAERLRNEMEDEKKAQGNSITQMFDRLKGENESRKLEIHGKIIIREHSFKIFYKWQVKWISQYICHFSTEMADISRHNF